MSTTNYVMPTPALVQQVVDPRFYVLERCYVLALCRGGGHFYDTYFAPSAPLADKQPEAASLAKDLQELCRTAPGVIEKLRREIAYLRQYGNKDCTAMADDAMLRGVLDDVNENVTVTKQTQAGETP